MAGDYNTTHTTFASTSSSPTILVATHASDHKGTSMASFNKLQTLPQLCNHFNKGTCKFGDRCKFIHDYRNRLGLTSHKNTSNRNHSNGGMFSTSIHPISHPHYYSLPYQNRIHQPLFNNRVGQKIPHQAQSTFAIQQAQQSLNSYSAQQPMQAQQTVVYPAQFQQVTTDPNRGILGAAPGSYPTRPTSLPSAYNTMTVQDSTWNMDTDGQTKDKETERIKEDFRSVIKELVQAGLAFTSATTLGIGVASNTTLFKETPATRIFLGWYALLGLMAILLAKITR